MANSPNLMTPEKALLPANRQERGWLSRTHTLRTRSPTTPTPRASSIVLQHRRCEESSPDLMTSGPAILPVTGGESGLGFLSPLPCHHTEDKWWRQLSHAHVLWDQLTYALTTRVRQLYCACPMKCGACSALPSTAASEWQDSSPALMPPGPGHLLAVGGYLQGRRDFSLIHAITGACLPHWYP